MISSHSDINFLGSGDAGGNVVQGGPGETLQTPTTDHAKFGSMGALMRAKQQGNKGRREAQKIKERETSITKKKTTASLMKVNSDFYHLQKNIARLETMRRAHDITDKDRASLNNKLSMWKQMLEKAEIPVTPLEEIERRLKVIEANEGLSEAFSCLWLAVLPYCEDDDTDTNNASIHVNMRLTKKGYYKFNRNMYVALTDNRNLESQKSYIDTRWAIDTKHMSVLEAVEKEQEREEAREAKKRKEKARKAPAYLVLDDSTDYDRKQSKGEDENGSTALLMSKTAFYNSIYDILDVWAELLDPKYYAIFAWSLLDSIADTTVYPPKLRAPNEVACTTKLDNEATMWDKFVRTGELRHSLSVGAKSMEKVPQVIRRLAARKKGTTVSSYQSQAISMMYAKMKREGLIHVYASDENTDSDEERLRQDELALRRERGLGAHNQAKGNVDSDSDSDDEMRKRNKFKNKFKLQLVSRQIKAVDKNYRETAAMAAKKRTKFVSGDSKDITKQKGRPGPRGIRPIAPAQGRRMADLTKTSKKSPEAIAKEKREKERQEAMKSPILNKYTYKNQTLDMWKYSSTVPGYAPMPSLGDMAQDQLESINPWDTRASSRQDGAGSVDGGHSIDTTDSFAAAQVAITRSLGREAVEWEQNFMRDITAHRLNMVYNKYDSVANTNIRNLQAGVDRVIEKQRVVREAQDAFRASRKKEAKLHRVAYRTMRAAAAEKNKVRKALLIQQVQESLIESTGVGAKSAMDSLESSSPTAKVMDLMLTGGELDASLFENMQGMSDTESFGSEGTTRKRAETAPTHGSSTRERGRKMSILVSETAHAARRAVPTITDSIGSLDLGSGIIDTAYGRSASTHGAGDRAAPGFERSLDTTHHMQALTDEVTKDAESLAMPPVLEKHESFRDSPLPKLRSEVELEVARRSAPVAATGALPVIDRPVTAPESTGPDGITGVNLHPYGSGSVSVLNDSFTGSVDSILGALQRRDASTILHAMTVHTPTGGLVDEYNWFDMPNITVDTLEARERLPAEASVMSSHMNSVVDLSHSLKAPIKLTPVQQEKALRKEKRRLEREARHAIKDRRKAYAIADILATRTKLRKQYRLV